MSNEKSSAAARLGAEISPVRLSGPFDNGLALSQFSIDEFHRRSYLGEFLRALKSKPDDTILETIGSFIIQAINANPLPCRPDLIVTIPDTIIGRSFSPTARLADRIAIHLRCPARHDLIRLKNAVTPQKERSLEERNNDRGTRYELRSGDILRNKSVLLFDDIYASGQSMNEAAVLVSKCHPSYLTVMTIVALG